MARAVWKGPFVEESLMKKVDKYKADPKKIPIKTWSRKSTIIPDFVGVSFLIYNGKKFIPITISEDMVGHKLGEFSPTRSFFGHTPADKKAKPTESSGMRCKFTEIAGSALRSPKNANQSAFASASFVGPGPAMANVSPLLAAVAHADAGPESPCNTKSMSSSHVSALNALTVYDLLTAPLAESASTTGNPWG